MTIITFSRQYGSGADEIITQVCQNLGYQYFDKKMIAQYSEEVDLTEQDVIDYSEENHRVRSFFDRLFTPSATVGQIRVWREDAEGLRSVEEIKFSEEGAQSLVQRAIQNAYKVGNMVIVGRGGQAILKNLPGVLHVRIIAPLEDRLQHVRDELKNNRQIYLADLEIRREAQNIIYEKDTASADYLKRFYQVDWNDPTLYHLIINTSKVEPGLAAEIITQMAQKMAVPLTEMLTPA